MKTGKKAVARSRQRRLGMHKSQRTSHAIYNVAPWLHELLQGGELGIRTEENSMSPPYAAEAMLSSIPFLNMYDLGSKWS